jgi:uncharacterized protein (TIGR03382 family)
VTLELTVSDGKEVSEPVTVEVEILPLNPVEHLQGANIPPAGCSCTTGGAEGLAPLFGIFLVALRGRRRRQR